MFHEAPSPYMLSKFIGYERAEKLVKQYSSLFDAKGDLLKEELFELLDAFEYIVNPMPFERFTIFKRSLKSFKRAKQREMIYSISNTIPVQNM